jgi:hypothetical protein
LNLGDLEVHQEARIACGDVCRWASMSQHGSLQQNVFV